MVAQKALAGVGLKRQKTNNNLRLTHCMHTEPFLVLQLDEQCTFKCFIINNQGSVWIDLYFHQVSLLLFYLFVILQIHSDKFMWPWNKTVLHFCRYWNGAWTINSFNRYSLTTSLEWCDPASHSRYENQWIFLIFSILDLLVKSHSFL